MIRVNCFLKINDLAHKDEVTENAAKLTEASLKHDGNVAYDIFPSHTRPDVALICETWRDADALKAHMQTPEFKLHVGNMEKYATMKIETFEFE
jgi:quinol monooxygenase YgiN